MKWLTSDGRQTNFVTLSRRLAKVLTLFLVYLLLLLLLLPSPRLSYVLFSQVTKQVISLSFLPATHDIR